MPILVNKDEKVKDICLKAYDEFIVNDIESFSLNKFITKIGISKGQFYHYFKTKEELVFEVMSFKAVENIQKIETKIKSVSDKRQKLQAVFSFYLDTDKESQKFRKLMFDSLHIFIHSTNDKIRQYNKEINLWVDEQIEKIYKQDDLSLKQMNLLKNISLTADGMFIRSLMEDKYSLENELEEYINLIVDTFED